MHTSCMYLLTVQIVQFIVPHCHTVKIQPKPFLVQSCALVLDFTRFQYQTAQLNNAVLLHKSTSSLQPLVLNYTIDKSFKMRYCFSFYFNCHRNYEWSYLELLYLLNKKHNSNFDHAYFLCQLRQKLIQYLILKLLSMVKWNTKGQSNLVLLCIKTALCIWAVQY